MAELQTEKHLRDVHSITEQFGKLGVNLGKLFVNIAESDAIKALMDGKRSPLTEKIEMVDAVEVPKLGKYQVLYLEGGAPEVKFIEKQETLKIPESISKKFNEYDLNNLKKNGHLGRVIMVENNGVAHDMYISLDKDLNNLATMSAKKISVPSTIKGVELNQDQIDGIKSGESVLIKGMKGKEGESFDAIVNVDALNKGLAFKSVNISNKILGVDIKPQEKIDMANGVPVELNGLMGQDGKLFNSKVHIDQKSGKMVFSPVDGQDNKLVREQILGVKLTDQQKVDYASGIPVFLRGLTSKKEPGMPFDAFVSINPVDNKIKFNSINLDKPIKGVSLTEEQKNILLSGNSVYVQGFKAESGNSYNADIKLDAQKGIAFSFEKTEKKAVEVEIINDSKVEKTSSQKLKSTPKVETSIAKAALTQERVAPSVKNSKALNIK